MIELFSEIENNYSQNITRDSGGPIDSPLFPKPFVE